MHVLVAEDNVVNQKLVTKFLEKLACTVSIVGDGQQALDYLANCQTIGTCRRPDIILMDVAMPVMGGIEATSIIRTQPPFSTDTRLRATPIIGLTAHAMMGDQERLISRGYNDILQKPLRFHIMKAKLLRWSQWQLALEGTAMVPAWGPYPLRAYRGPRSRL